MCERLECIPLAVELAAARVRTFTPEQIEERLDDVFRLLTAGRRTARPRQQTIRGTIDWSYDLLSESERTLLRRLSVFAGGWTLGAAEAMAADAVSQQLPVEGGTWLDAADIAALLDQLVSKSLVGVGASVASDGGEPRYRMLEVVRKYANEKLLQAGEFAPVRSRHLAYCCALTDHVNRSTQGVQVHAWYDRIREEIDNVRAALDWALQSGDRVAGIRLVDNLVEFWSVRGYVREGLRWATALLPDAHTAGDPRVGYHTHQILGDLHFGGGDYEKSRQHEYAALSLAEQVGDNEIVRDALAHLMHLAPESSLAYALADRLLSIAHKDDRWVVGWVDYDLGRRERLAGNFTEATRRLRASAAAALTIEGPSYWGSATGELAFVAAAQGDLAASRALWEQVVANYRLIENPWLCALALVELGAVLMRQDDAAAGLPLVQECIATFYRQDDGGRMGESVAVAAWAPYLRGDAGHAACLLSATEALWQRAGQYGTFQIDERSEYERLLPLVRAALPPAQFQQAWTEGQQMTLDQVIADVMALQAG